MKKALHSTFLLGLLMIAGSAYAAPTISSYSRTPSGMNVEAGIVELSFNATGLNTGYRYDVTIVINETYEVLSDLRCVSVGSTSALFEPTFDFTGVNQTIWSVRPIIREWQSTACTGTNNVTNLYRNTSDFILTPSTEAGDITVEDSLFKNILYAIMLWLILCGTVAFTTYKLTK